MQNHHGISARRADRTLGLSRSVRRHRPRPYDDSPLIDVIQGHLKDNPGHDFGLLFNQTLRPHRKSAGIRFPVARYSLIPAHIPSPLSCR